jgi:hypothetical protein
MAETTTTREHEEIRRWVEERGGRPARVRGTDILRIDFAEPEEDLEEISWDEFFRIFDENGLEFLHQDRVNGGASRFNKFVRSSD